MKVTLPFPDMKLSANSTKGMHWAAVARMRKAARKMAWAIAKEHGLIYIKAEKVNVTITFHQPDKINRNADNVISAFKSYQDGLADAIEIPDERWNPQYKFGEIVKGGKTEIQFEVA